VGGGGIHCADAWPVDIEELFMTAKKCKCHPDSPFLWASNPKPSMFIKEVYFRPKKVQTYDNLTQEENIVAYKQFSIHSRAHPKIKPQLNKHEIS
jgi:hypothetical protein